MTRYIYNQNNAKLKKNILDESLKTVYKYKIVNDVILFDL